MTYFTIAGALWGASEAYTYFSGDKLKTVIGDYWYVIYIIIPIIFSLITGASLLKRRNKQIQRETGATINQNQNGGKNSINIQIGTSQATNSDHHDQSN